MVEERFYGEIAEAGRRVFKGENGGVVTRDSAGSTTGWNRQEAEELHRRLGELLYGPGKDDAALIYLKQKISSRDNPNPSYQGALEDALLDLFGIKVLRETKVTVSFIPEVGAVQIP